MSWNLHIVGDHVPEDLVSIGDAVVKAIEGTGQQLVSARFTTDVGTSDLPVTPAPEPAPEPAPSPEPSPAPAEPAPAPTDGTQLAQ